MLYANKTKNHEHRTQAVTKVFFFTYVILGLKFLSLTKDLDFARQ